ncbi:MAG: hypothetical protein R2695_16730 [Acidimicrobiales bacterium]
MHQRTTIVIAHRPATIALADRVVLLDQGRVAAEGPTRICSRRSRGTERCSGPIVGTRGNGALMGWAMGHATDPEDQLDLAATRHVLRRTLTMLSPTAGT